MAKKSFYCPYSGEPAEEGKMKAVSEHPVEPQGLAPLAAWVAAKLRLSHP